MKLFYTRKPFLYLGLCSAILLLNSCKKESSISVASESTLLENNVSERSCGTQQALQLQLNADPSLRKRMEQVEVFTQKILAQKKAERIDGTTSTLTTLTIPVVVNVVYNGAAQNISDAQIQSQIAVLNEDFQRLNADASKTPAEFATSAASLDIKFTLNKIVRKSSTVIGWTTDNKIKSLKTGGINPTNASSMLNIWVCNLSGGVLGYAQYPGGNASTDGVVIQYNAFGKTGTTMSRFNLGRTTTHEISHWMNLRHIWGDGPCSDDKVGDTPPHNAANSGVPTYPHYSTCAGAPVEMTMNFLDYTDDVAMNMFTAGQRDLARACFATGGPRYSYYIK